MANVFLFIAAIVDVVLAVILIGVSGFLFGSGPESMHGGTLLTVVYTAAVIGCLVVPVVGLVLHRRGKTAAGMLHCMAAAGRRAAHARHSGALLTPPNAAAS